LHLSLISQIVASFSYAVRLMELPQGVFGISLATYLLPTCQDWPRKSAMTISAPHSDKGLVICVLLIFGLGFVDRLGGANDPPAF